MTKEQTSREEVRFLEKLRDQFHQLPERGSLEEQVIFLARKGWSRGSGSFPPDNINEISRELLENFSKTGGTQRQIRFMVYGAAYVMGEASKIAAEVVSQKFPALADGSRVEGVLERIGL